VDRGSRVEDADRDPDHSVVVGSDEADHAVVGDLSGQEGSVPVARVGAGRQNTSW